MINLKKLFLNNFDKICNKLGFKIKILMERGKNPIKKLKKENL